MIATNWLLYRLYVGVGVATIAGHLNMNFAEIYAIRDEAYCLTTMHDEF